MMSCPSTMSYVFLIYFLLSSNSRGTAMAGRDIPMLHSVPSTMMAPLDSSHGEDYVKMKPRSDQNRPFFGGRDVKGCLPKGYRHSSAPSRFVNNLPLLVCSKLYKKP
ncbi:hypothetical protein OIU85_028602 [Salix viminalis]|uniref:Neprosin activation peptide domain-containing protein n=1 Tax=Salix viminalis TaxID=40686 RepID=A0A9Q0QKG4_SALVM|nr:hypothetical protein OIU85_028602 [Salix viminalis]